MGKFKMKGWKPFSKLGDKIKVARAKRLTKKYVGKTTVDGPDTFNISDDEYNKADMKVHKADMLLKKAGYSHEQREEATGPEGYQTAMDWATNKKKKKNGGAFKLEDEKKKEGKKKYMSPQRQKIFQRMGMNKITEGYDPVTGEKKK